MAEEENRLVSSMTMRYRNATTGNAGSSLYISPPTITTRVDGTSSFTLTTQTTTPPLCY